MTRLTALLGLLALASCAQPLPSVPRTITVTKTIYIPWEMPVTLETCAPDPAPVIKPAIPLGDPHGSSKVAEYIVNLQAYGAAATAAADDCRGTLYAVTQAAKTPPLQQ